MTLAVGAWGMSSMTFFVLYGCLCLGTWIANVLAWRWAGGMAADERAAAELDVYDVAVLNGGPPLAITTAVTMLHGGGVLCDGWIPGTLAVSPGWGGDETRLAPLERQVVAVVRRTGEITPAALEHELEDAPAIERTIAGLTQAGLIVDRARVVWTRLLYLSGPPALAALGASWLASAWSDHNDEPMVWVGIMVLAAVLATIEHVVTDLDHGHGPIPTEGGRAALRRRQDAERPDDLSPGTPAAWEVALAGAWALWSAEPALAAQLDAPREPVSVDAGGGCGACGCG